MDQQAQNFFNFAVLIVLFGIIVSMLPACSTDNDDSRGVRDFYERLDRQSGGSSQ